MNTMLPTTLRFEDLLDRFDVFLLDQFGVLLDEAGLYKGADAALKMLADAGKKIAVVSNSGKTSAVNRLRMAQLGIPVGCIDYIVTSGQVGHAHLRGLAGQAGDLRVFLMARGDDTSVLEGIGCEVVLRADQADLILLSGSQADTHGLAHCIDRLRVAAAKNVPCLCLNPDMVMLTKAGTAPGAGAIAEGYAKLGGTVTWIGKPHSEIFEYALAGLDLPAQPRLCVIGDSLTHDIAGGHTLDAATILVRTGIHAATPARDLPDLFAQYGTTPDYLMQAFACTSADTGQDRSRVDDHR